MSLFAKFFSNTPEHSERSVATQLVFAYNQTRMSVSDFAKKHLPGAVLKPEYAAFTLSDLHLSIVPEFRRRLLNCESKPVPAALECCEAL